MEVKKQLTGLRKRQQIQKASQTMFMWVAIASVVVSLCLVAGQFLVKQGLFNQKIISAKSEAAGTLQDNIDAADELKTNVNALLGNGDLGSVKAYPGESNLQVVLDALPSTNDPAALAASLQQVVLKNSNVTITSLSAPTDFDLEDEDSAVTEDGATEQAFTFEIDGSYDQISKALKDIERTIRPLNLTHLSFQGSDNQLRVTGTGVTYYLPAKTVQIKKETIKP